MYSTRSSTRGKWHTGWVHKSAALEKNKQVFRIQRKWYPEDDIDDLDFTYEELTKDMTKCVGRVRKLDLGTNEEDYKSLESYMRAFIADVEKTFKAKEQSVPHSKKRPEK